MKIKLNKVLIIKIIVVMLLLGALADNPYGYYQVLRWVVCGVFGYSAYLAYEKKEVVWIWILGIIAVLFNPFIPFYLSREIWTIVNIISAVVLIVNVFYTLSKNER